MERFWEALNTFAVPPNATTEYFARILWETLRARISTPVTGRLSRSWPLDLRSNEAGVSSLQCGAGDLRSVLLLWLEARDVGSPVGERCPV